MNESDPRITVRLGPDGRERLEALAASRGVSSSRCVRQLVDEAAPDGPRPKPRRLSEDELLDLLRERALDGNVSAITRLLEIERRSNPDAAALDALRRMADQ